MDVKRISFLALLLFASVFSISLVSYIFSNHSFFQRQGDFVQLPPTRSSGFHLVVCAIFHNEAPYLAEWVAYHLLLGVEHFYLYDQNSTDNWNAVLLPFVHLGLVTAIPWSNASRDPVQTQKIQHCLKNFGPMTKWMAEIEIDEFIAHNYFDLSLTEALLKHFSSFAGLVLSRKKFHNGQYPANSLVIMNSVRRDVLVHLNTSERGKLIFRPDMILLSATSPHDAIAVNGSNGFVNCQKQQGPRSHQSVHVPLVFEPIWINHYPMRNATQSLPGAPIRDDFLALRYGRAVQKMIHQMQHW